VGAQSVPEDWADKFFEPKTEAAITMLVIKAKRLTFKVHLLRWMD
jgi:hypothetical protein